ncbi:MAG: HDIG domain-containing protein [Bacteroidetes bacterium]|nr:HDIG domain-containing protein [Bacteroidota bacterium]
MKRFLRRFFERITRALRSNRWRRSKFVRLTIGIGLTLVLAVLFPQAQSPQNVTGYSVGALWTSADVVAPFNFRLLKDPTKYRGEVNRALENYYPVFIFDTSAKQRTIDSVRTVLAAIGATSDSGATASEPVSKIVATAELSSDETTLIRRYVNESRTLTAKSAEPDLQAITSVIGAVFDKSRICTNVPAEYQSTDRKIVIRNRSTEEILVTAGSLASRDAAKNDLTEGFDRVVRGKSELRKALGKLSAALLVPNVSYDQSQSDSSRKLIAARVPRTEGVVLEGQKIIGKGDVITPQAKAALESLAEARIEQGGTGTMIGRALGTIGHVFIIVTLFVLYVKFIRRRIYKDNAQLLLISVILIFPALLAYVSVLIHTSFPVEYLILIPVSSMLLTVLFDSRTGFYGTVIAALLVAGIRGNDYNVALAGLSAGAFAAYTVRDLRSRSQLFTSIGFIFLGYVIAIAALSFERGMPLNELGLELIAAAVNSLISPVLTLAFVYVVEGMFDTVSDLRLVEFDDINHPLLQRLSLEAPGTYHHTMLVAQLSENAAVAIGANALLAKVGALYHDIGKIASPTDFIENQIADQANVHDTLSAIESASRVRAHVIAGIALAREHNLPEKLVDFIPMHHGTMRISFFYQQALNSMSAGGTLDDSLFRYPGPKPNSKETAILMLADASEAITRNLGSHIEEPTVEILETELGMLFRDRIADGQLDECDLTMRDLVIVRNVFARLLIGTFHSRINYPQASAKRTEPASNA